MTTSACPAKKYVQQQRPYSTFHGHPDQQAYVRDFVPGRAQLKQH